MHPYLASCPRSLIDRVTFTAAMTAGPLLLVGCGDPVRPTGPSAAMPAASRVVAGHARAGTRRVNMMDACDVTTFNAAVGAGTCSRRHGVRFDDFIAELTRSGRAGAWHFAPPTTRARSDETLLAVNRGGEVHTFTRVAAFGGGIVPPLNDLSHNPVVAPECTTLEEDDFVAPGGTYEEEIAATGTLLFQCCIHPWMRLTVHVPSR